MAGAKIDKAASGDIILIVNLKTCADDEARRREQVTLSVAD